MPDGSMRIEGGRIVLRDWRLDDLERFAFWLDPGQRWHTLDGPYYPKLPVDQIPEMIARRREAIVRGEPPDPRTSLVIADRETDALLGQVTWYWESAETHWLSVGIGIYDPELWGGGLGCEALALSVHIPGNVLAGNWTAVVYVDDQATKTQEEALLKVFTGQLGGAIADIAGLIGEVVAVERAPSHPCLPTVRR